MKAFFSFFVIFLIFSVINCAQTTKDYEIYFTANPALDSVKAWSIYLEQKSNNGTFLIQDGMEYTTLMDPSYEGEIMNTGQVGEVIYPITLPMNGQWVVPGVIAYTKEGIPSQVGASGSIRIAKKPGKPGGVGIREKP